MRRFGLVSLFLFCIPSAYASLSFEPYIGVGAGFFNMPKPYLNLTTTGGRIGYTRWGLMMGGDISYAYYVPLNSNIILPNFDQNTSSAKRGLVQVAAPSSQGSLDSIEPDYKAYQVLTYGPSVSFTLPIVIDGYVSLVWSHAISPNHHQLSGAGLKAGLSYLSLPFLSLNMELQIINYISCYSFKEEEICEDDNNIPLGPSYMVHTYLSIPISTGWL